MQSDRPGWWQVLGAGGAAGVLLLAATAQVGVGLLCFVALLPLLALIDSGVRPGAAAAAGWLCGIVLFGSVLAWAPIAGYRGVLLLGAGYVLAAHSTRRIA